MKNKISLLLLIAVLVTALFSCSSTNTTGPEFYYDDSTSLIVHYIDVGQGNSILLESKDHFVLMDAGEDEYSKSVCDYITSRNAQRIDYVIATHPHTDHIGGLTAVINKFDCKCFITPETNQNTKQWLDVLSAVDSNNVEFTDPVVGATYSFGEATFEILAPNSDKYDGYNNYSIVIKVKCGNTSFLFCGDAEKQSEKEMLNNNLDVSADVIMLGHHGSSTSSSDDFLSKVNPSYAVISCGKNNDYGHPHKETLNKINKMTVPCYRTDKLGTIIATSDKEKICFYYDKNNNYVSDTEDQNSTTIQNSETYIGNKNSKKFHKSTCSGVEKILQKNKVVFSSREEAVKNGYTECKLCNP